MTQRTGRMAAALVALTLVATAAWGGGNSAKSGTTATPTATGERNLGGMEIVVGNWWADYDVNTYVPQTTEEERTLAWRTEVQKKYNFKMREENIAGWGETQELAATSIMAGKPAASIITLQPDWAMALYNQGLFYPAGDCPSVDLSKTSPVGWNQNIVNAFTFNGKTYGFEVQAGSGAGVGVFFNKRLFAEAGIDPNLPYDMQKAGTWTWDAFIDLCKRLNRDINNDGILDTYALASFSTDTLTAIIASNRAQYVDKDARGRLVNATNKPEFLQALQFAIRLSTEGLLMPQPPNSNWDWFTSAFHDGKAAMRVAGQYVNGDLKDMADDWGFVMFPKGPNASTYTVAASGNVLVIPGTFSAEEADKILFAYYQWVTPPPGNDNPDAWKIAAYPTHRDSRAVDETRAMLRDPAHIIFAYNVLVPGLSTGDIAWNMWNEGVDPAQLIESVSQSWNDTINKANGVN